MPMKADLELDAGSSTFASGLLPQLIAALRRSGPGDLIAVVSGDASLGIDLDAWCRFTRNSLIESTTENGRTRWVIRYGEAPADDARPIGSRVWLYTNFDCNLRCDYCCVRSSPEAPRRALGLERVRRIASEAGGLGVGEFFVTGGEPFLLPDIGQILSACAAAAPTTVLTNGMLFAGPRLASLRALPRDRVTLQISIDSPTPAQHDRHRGQGSWARAWRGIERARAEGFRVRLAATVSDDAEAQEFSRFLDARQIRAEDRVIRRIALRGAAAQGLALVRADLVPEITITAEGVYWHPVGADDADLFLTAEIFPLADAFAALRRALDREREHGRRLASIFNCA
jgi:pyruvate-formate lyase-activating enzyme/TusA-related sulfurtransferase